MLNRRTRPISAYGFNLIELLVVIGIVAIAAALLLSVVHQAKTTALRIQCINNLRQLGIALKAFNNDYNVYPLYVNIDFSKGAYPEHHQLWDYALEYEELTASKGTNDLFARGVWVCPAAPRPSNYSTYSEWLTYGYNAYGIANGYRTETNVLGLGVKLTESPHTLAPPVSESEVLNPSEMMAIGEVFNSSPLFSRTPAIADSEKASLRHQKKANVVFCDGHEESPSLQVLFQSTNNAALSRWNRDNLPHRDLLQ